MEANNLHDLVIRNGKILDGSGRKSFLVILPLMMEKLHQLERLRDLAKKSLMQKVIW